MKSTILVGPILGIESDSIYTICLLTEKAVSHVAATIENKKVKAEKIADTASGHFWRVEIKLRMNPENRFVKYTIDLDGEISNDKNNRSSWNFFVPGSKQAPKFAYTSCNGFSSESLKEKTSNPYFLWEEMAKQHNKAPFSLLLMGGDQLYADSIWGEVKKLAEWSDLPRKEKVKRKASKVMDQQIESFYDQLYRKRWSKPAMSLLLASIPSVMMWDDHDIFDGWGSYPKDIQECDVYQCIFKHAKKYFELYQIRTIKNKSLINPASTHYAFSFPFRDYHILAIDNRAERTLDRIMSDSQWDDISTTLNGVKNDSELLLLSAVPVVYRDFSFSEGVFEATPWEEELTDDLKDQWRAKEHQGERAKLIMNLLENAKRRKGCSIILSGDIHLGCLGVINDRRDPNKPIKIHQIVSSGIVHPSPSMIAWHGIMAVTNDRDEYLNEEHTIKVSMVKPFGSDKYIRSRNYITLEMGIDEKLWVNWICEHTDNPAYPLERQKN